MFRVFYYKWIKGWCRHFCIFCEYNNKYNTLCGITRYAIKIGLYKPP